MIAGKEQQHNISKIGTALTLLCSVHCLATPFLALFIPFFNSHDMDWLELAIIGGVVVLGSSSMMHGYKDHHGNKWPLIFFLTGIALLISGFAIHGANLPFLHKALMIIGSLSAAVGQLLNLKLNRTLA
jgi:intracellular septation protein A